MSGTEGSSSVLVEMSKEAIETEGRHESVETGANSASG